MPRIDELVLPVLSLDAFATSGEGYHEQLAELARDHRFARIGPGTALPCGTAVRRVPRRWAVFVGAPDDEVTFPAGTC